MNAIPLYIISALSKEIIPVLYCSADVSLAQDMCSFLDEHLFVTIPTSEEQNSTTDIDISSDTDIKNTLSVFRRMLVLLTENCSHLFIDTVQKLIRLQTINSKVFLLYCGMQNHIVDELKGCHFSVTKRSSIKSHALSFLSQPNGKVLSFMFF